MHWRWFIFDYVDPQLGLTPSERRKVRAKLRKLRDSRGHMRQHPMQVLILSVVPAMGMAVAMLPMFVGSWSRGWYMIPLALVTQIAITWTALAVVGRWAYRPMLIEALRQLGYDVCPHCGYDLHALPEQAKRCPECGADQM